MFFCLFIFIYFHSFTGSPIMLGANPLPGVHEVDFNNTNTTNSSPLVLTTEAPLVGEEQNETRLEVNETKVGD